MKRLVIALITSFVFLAIGCSKLSNYSVLDEIDRPFSLDNSEEYIENEINVNESTTYECNNNGSIEGIYKYISVDEALKREINIKSNKDGSMELSHKYISLNENNEDIDNEVEKSNFLKGTIKINEKNKWNGTLENEAYGKKVNESIISTEIASLNFEESSNIGKVVIVEKYKIKYNNGGEVIKSFKNNYEFKYNEINKKLILTKVTSI